MFKREKILIIIYVDDVIIAAPTKGEIEEIMKSLRARFRIHDIGELKRF